MKRRGVRTSTAILALGVVSLIGGTMYVAAVASSPDSLDIRSSAANDVTKVCQKQCQDKTNSVQCVAKCLKEKEKPSQRNEQMPNDQGGTNKKEKSTCSGKNSSICNEQDGCKWRNCGNANTGCYSKSMPQAIVCFAGQVLQPPAPEVEPASLLENEYVPL